MFKGLTKIWEMTRSNLILSLRSLWLHKLRSFLSVLGIIIGTAAVIILTAVGSGNMQDALEDIKRQGATNIVVRSMKPSDDASSQRRTMILKYGLTADDYDRLRMLPGVVSNVPMRYFPQEIRRLGYMIQGRLVATTETYQNVNQFEMVDGRFLRDADKSSAEGDNTRRRNVAVLGATVAARLFPFQSAVGESIILNKQNFVVIGVIGERLNVGGAGSEDVNLDVYIPLSTGEVRYGEKVFIRTSGARMGEQVELHQVTLTVADIHLVREVGEIVRGTLQSAHNRQDWDVYVPLDRLEEAERAQTRGKWLLVAVAGISLLVGGIGIMNIMLATVTERTREIGIRRALGAKRRDIIVQFVVEAVAQTGIGGLLGVLLSLGVVFGVPPLVSWLWQERIPTKVEIDSIFLAVSCSIGVGLCFGLYPAYRASRLHPIEALRHV